MASYLRTSRNLELSTLYYLEQQLASDWSSVNFLKTFSQVYSSDYDVPIVCARLVDVASTRLEVGSNTLDDAYLIVVDVFGRSSAQTLDLSDYLKSKLQESWVYYTHSHASGDNSTLERVASGKCYVTDFISDSIIYIDGSTDPKDRHRHSISVRVKNT